MGSARDAAVKGYIRLPKGVRHFTDPLVKNRAKTPESFEKAAERPTRRPRLGSPDYRVTLYFDDGQESHRVPATTLTDAAQQGIRSIQTPKVPRRMRIRRLKS